TTRSRGCATCSRRRAIRSAIEADLLEPGFAAGLADRRDELAVEAAVRRHDLAVAQHDRAAVVAGDRATRGAHERDAGAAVPRGELLLPVAVVRAVGDEREVDGGRAAAADALRAQLERRELGEVVVRARAAVVREARRDERFVERRGGAHLARDA